MGSGPRRAGPEPRGEARLKQLLDSEQVADAVESLYRQVEASLPAAGPDGPRVAIVGIRTRGETLARRLRERIAAGPDGRGVEFGVLDITFYRDDLSRSRGVPLVRATEIDFDVDDTWLLLVDDVMETGRSVRAALNAVHDFGRPRVVRLAVLIDRGGREVPVAADFVGTRVEVDPAMRVQLRLKENDGQEGALIVPKS